MATATGFTAARMLQIENKTVSSGLVDVNGHLILSTRDATKIDAGYVVGPKGATGLKGDPGTPAAIIDVYHPVTDAIGAYPGGISMFQITGQTDWPSLTGTVKTTMVSGGRAYQEVVEKTTGMMWRRATTDAPTNWGPWVLVYGYSRELLANVNLNTLVGPGSYTQSNDSEATLGLNYPVAKAGILRVDGLSDGSFLSQEYRMHLGPTWTRTYLYGAWSPWTMVAKPTSQTTISTYSNNFTYASSTADNPLVYQRNGQAMLSCRVRQTAGFTGGVAFTIPDGIRPAANIQNVRPASVNGGNVPGPELVASITASTGAVTIARANNSTSPVWDANTWVVVQIPYIAQEAP